MLNFLTEYACETHVMFNIPNLKSEKRNVLSEKSEPLWHPLPLPLCQKFCPAVHGPVTLFNCISISCLIATMLLISAF